MMKPTRTRIDTNMKTVARKMSCLLIPALLFAVSCGHGKKGAPAGMTAKVKEYSVMEIKTQSTTLYKEYPAVLEGQQTVEIRPKIAGYIEQILVDEGAHVTKGQLLFRSERQRPSGNAMRSSRKRRVKVAEADVYSAQINLEKTKPLVEKSIVSKFDLAICGIGTESKGSAKSSGKSQSGKCQRKICSTPQIYQPGRWNDWDIPLPYRQSGEQQPLRGTVDYTVSNTRKDVRVFLAERKRLSTI